MEKIIGIDLGTTNSCLAVWEMGKATVINNEEGRKTTPSVVTFTPSGRKIGEVAKRQAAMYPKTTISSVKRLMGESYASVKNSLSQFSYNVVKDENGQATISIDQELFPPQKVSAYVLASLKADAERYLGQTINRAVITVPAYFNEKQRQATIDAGKMAGLKVERILNEPTAAAMAYSQISEKYGKIIVFDLGGGTFDISILNCTEKGYDVIATKGDVHCGGDDIDKLLTDMLVAEYIERNGGDFTLDAIQTLRVREVAEQAKIALSTSLSYEVAIAYLHPDPQKSHLYHYLLRSELEELAAPIVNHCIDLCGQVLEDANLTKADIDHVLLVGGATKMPLIRSKVQEFFSKEPCFSQEADEIVAIGACIEGAIINGSIKDKVLLDVTPLSLGVLARNNEYQEIIAPNTTLPTDSTLRFLAAHENQEMASIIVCQARNSMDRRWKRIKAFDIFIASDAGNPVPKIDINFDLNEEGILTVKATDVASGTSERLRIGSIRDFSQQQLDKMAQEVQSDLEYDRGQKWKQTFPMLSRAVEKARGMMKQDQMSMGDLSALIEKFDSLTFSETPKEKHQCAKDILVRLKETEDSL